MAGFSNDIMLAANVNFTSSTKTATVTSDGQLMIGAGSGQAIRINTLTAGTGITITNGPGTISIASTAATTDLHAPRYIVASSTSGTGANYTTIASAISAAQASGVNSTIFIQPGTYTEDLTMVAGVNLCAFVGDSFTPTVTIVGKITATYTGTCSISNIRLQTNGDYCVESTGANTLTLFLLGCYINATNANAIHWTNANAGIELFGCRGACSTNTFFIVTAGSINVYFCVLAGTNTTTNSTFSGGALDMKHSYFSSPITTSGTGAVGLFKSEIICTNTTALTHGGSGNSIVMETRFESGTASAISIGATLPVMHSSVFSTNANAITGAGTLLYGIIVFYGSGASSTVNTGTQTALATLI